MSGQSSDCATVMASAAGITRRGSENQKPGSTQVSTVRSRACSKIRPTTRLIDRQPIRRPPFPASLPLLVDRLVSHCGPSWTTRTEQVVQDHASRDMFLLG